MSPPLVVAYALAGRIDIDLDKEPLGEGTGGKPVYLRDIWPTTQRGERARRQGGQAGDVPEVLRRGLRGGRALAESRRAGAATPTCSSRRRPTSSTRPTSRGCRRRPATSSDIKGARVLAVLGDSVTTDHISPAGSIKKDGPAGKYLIDHGVDRQGLQQLRRPPRQPRGDGARHLRQRSAQEPARPGHRGRRHPPPARRRADVDLRSEREVRRRARAARHPGRQGVRLGLVARLGGEGPAPAGRPRGHRRELRAHPPQQPGRHGHRALQFTHGRDGRLARPHRRGDLRDRRACRRCWQSGFAGGRELVVRATGAAARPRRSAPWSGSTRRRRSPTTSTAASCTTCSASSPERRRGPERQGAGGTPHPTLSPLGGERAGRGRSAINSAELWF